MKQKKLKIEESLEGSLVGASGYTESSVIFAIRCCGSLVYSKL